MTENMIYYTPEMIMETEYYKFPKWLMGVNISNDSKILYMLLLDRYKLSLKNKWIDEENKVFCYFSKASVQGMLEIGKTKSYELFKELEDSSLIEQVRQGQGKNNRLYLKSVDYTEYIKMSEKRTSENNDTEYRVQTYEKRTSRCSNIDNLDVHNSDCNNNNSSENELSNVVVGQEDEQNDYDILTKRINEVVEQYRINYSKEIELFGTDDVETVKPALCNFIVKFFDDYDIHRIINLSDGDLFELFDKFKGLLNLNSIETKYDRVKNPDGFMISEIRKRLNKRRRDALC